MVMILKGRLVRWALMGVEVVVFTVPVIWATKACVAELTARKITLQNLQMAARLDPRNSDYQLQLGHFFQYSITDTDPDRALEHLKHAVALNPFDAQPWLDLGAALELQGKTSEAEGCLHRASALAPNMPAFQYAIGNFFLLHGNVDEAFRHFKVVLGGTSEFNHILFDTAWKASGDASKILEQVIPHDLPTEFDYLNYLAAQQRFKEAQSVWRRIVGSRKVFNPSQAGDYLETLIHQRRPEEAHRIWEDLLTRGLINPTFHPSGENLLVNGDFEEDILNMGFDWRVLPLEGEYAGLDRTHFHSPGHALLIHFTGKQNLHYQHVYQYARVVPGRSYKVRGFIMTEGLTTDSGVRLEVRDAYDPSLLDSLSEALTGSTISWVPVEVFFTPGPKTELVVVAVARLPSTKIDNLIAGKVWVDDLSLTFSSEEGSPARKR